jgi:signal transduction histidine kinase
MHDDRFDRFLWGQILLFGLLGAALALFVTYPSVGGPYLLPELKLVLATVFTIAGALVAVLTAARFRVESRRYDLFLCFGFLLTSASWALFTIGPAVTHSSLDAAETWGGTVGRLAGWSFVAAASWSRGRTRHPRVALWNGLLACAAALIVLWALSGARAPGIRALDVLLAAQALCHLLAVLGFGNRFRVHGADLDYWLSLGSTLLLFSSLQFIFTPFAGVGAVTQGDYLRLLAYGVLLAGVWRAIRSTEFGRAVAEERARVAREIHDGLAQYLFAISTHASMLESGADQKDVLPQLKEAAIAAQQEARYAILALSSASGRAPFDAAIRRYVDFLTADGALEVELEIDPAIALGPDEQIEVFRIVQEGLANARRHAGARHAWVEIGARAGTRFVSVRDDGSGFEPDEEAGGQGLRNMRDRSKAIGGALSLRSAPGAGTALEIVLRG